MHVLRAFEVSEYSRIDLCMNICLKKQKNHSCLHLDCPSLWVDARPLGVWLYLAGPRRTIQHLKTSHTKIILGTTLFLNLSKNWIVNLAGFFSISGLIQNHLEGKKGTMFSKNCDYLVENEFSSSSRGQRPAAESLNSDLCNREFPICKNNKKIDPSIEICQFG